MLKYAQSRSKKQGQKWRTVKLGGLASLSETSSPANPSRRSSRKGVKVKKKSWGSQNEALMNARL
jgi:hypothetical protein